ncbi:MAG: N-acetylglucosamine-6-phosphate deacetylase [Caldilineaceae bacterium]|nr:N-acetylglucosamine-6-phosphate deacetylase [Caldilineaceae bacterium]
MASNRNAELCAIYNGRVVLPDRVVEDRALLVDGGRIAGLRAIDQLPAECALMDARGGWVTPGLVDLHIHGAVGHTFNEGTPAAFGAITRACAGAGVTSLLATTTTAPLEQLVQALATLKAWGQTPQDGGARPGARILGAHVEGPYFAPSQAGAQDPKHLRVPTDRAYEQLLAYADLIRIFTFAPELPGAAQLTDRLVALGIVPAAGHSAAREEDVRPLLARGLRHMIHLWSGQSTTIREGAWRKPGLLEVSLTYDGLTAEMIADGKHLPPTLMRLACKCVGPERLCIISDATSGAGLPDGARFHMGEMEYEVAGGVGMMLDGSAFAGSTTLLNQMMRVVIEQVGLPVVDVVRMASLTPARVIGVDDHKGSLTAGKDADVVIFGDDWHPHRVMAGGRWLVGTAQDEEKRDA